MAKKVKDQPSRRRERTYLDRHGRKWHATIELDSGGPSGPVSPVGWRDRLKTPEKYKKISKDGMEISIDYAAWERDVLQRLAEWDNELRQYAMAMYGQGASQAIANPPPELLSLVGPKPVPIELIQAARAGNKYVLGLSDRMPKWAEPFFAAPARPTLPKFPDAEEEELTEQLRAQYPDEDDEQQETRFPRRKGKGGNVYELSDGSTMRGSEEAAEQAERALRQTATIGAGQPGAPEEVDNSWLPED